MFPNNLLCQININGIITDLNNKPVEFLEVQLQNKDSIIFKSTLTNIYGDFKVTVEKGDYSLLIRQLGKILKTQKIIVMQDSDLGIIQVAENQQKLNEVTVVANKKLIERKVDRIVFNFENSISANIGDAIDALKITPNIRVTTEQVSMIGKSNMAVMINDKIINLSGDDLINFLRTIASDNIKSIEVITNPPAKYDAEGNSGLINIKLKKIKADSWNSTINSGYKRNTYSTGNIGGTYSFQKNKISLVVNTNYSNGAIQGIENSKIIYPSLLWASTNIGKYLTNMLSNRLGFDYQITKSWSMGIQYIGSNNKPNINDSNNIDLSNKVNVSKGSIKTSGESTRKRVLNSINYHSNIDLDTLGRSISFDIDYLNYNSNNNRTFNSLTTSSNQAEIQNGYFSANNSTNQKIENYAAQINIEHPLKLVKLSYGSKISYSKTKNLVEFFNTTSGTPILDKMQSNLFEYKENIQALYFSGNKKFVNNKYEVEVGLRAENTQTEGVSISLNKVTPNKFLEFFPTIYLGYTLNENKSFYINYGRRITRPNFNSLNPFKWFSDPYTYVEGNPNLRPTYSHNLELNFSYKDFLFTNLSYTKNKDGSGQVPILDQADFIQRITRLNFFDSYSIGLQQVYVFKKYSWLESQNSFALFFQHSDSKIFPLTPKSNQGFGASFSCSNTITINKQKTIFSGLEFQHNFPNQSGDLVYNYAITQLNLNFKMLLLEKKLQISVAGNNLFKAFDFNNISTRNYIEATYNGYYDTQDLRLNLMFKFGSNKVNVNQRKISNEDEKNRVK